MKGKKRYIILALLLIIFGLILFFTKDDRKKTIEEKEEQINEDIEERERKSIKLTTITEIDKKEYGEVIGNLGNLILFRNNDTNYILDSTGNKLSTSKSLIQLEKYDSGLYYILEDNLYDSKGKIVYEKPSDSSKILQLNDKYIVLYYENENYEKTKEKLVNYENEEITTFTSFIGFFNDIPVYYKNDKIVVFDKEEKIYDKFEERDGYSFLHLTSSSEEIYLNKNKGYITKDEYYKEKLNGSYYLEFEDCLKLKSIKTDELVFNECFNTYEKITDNYYVLTDYNETTYLIRGDKIEILKNYSRGYVDEKLYYASKGDRDNNYFVFYENSDNVELECPSYVVYTGNNVFSCNDKVESYFIKNNKISEEKYDEINCSYENNYCVVEKNNKYGLYYMGEKIIEPIYQKIEILGDNIIISANDKYYLLSRESGKKALTKEQLNIKINNIEYDIDIDKVIEENDLDKYKDIINDNKELFKKYASSVEQNDNLGIYKKYVYDYFSVITNYKDYIDEKFFYTLRDLKIVEEDELSVDGAAGLFQLTRNEIQISKKYSGQSRVTLHELMHFIDYSLNNNQDIDLLLDDKVISKEDYEKLSLNEKRKVDLYKESVFDIRFIVEGGAEKYSSQHFFDSYVISYDYPCNLFYIFEYILGSDTMKKVYYANKSFYQLVGQYLPEDNYLKFKEVTNKITSLTESTTVEDYQFVFDTIIDIYTNIKGEQWYNDSEFCFLLYNLNRLTLAYLKNSKYYNTYEKIHNFYALEHEKYGKKIASMNNEVYVSNPRIIYENDNIYFLEFYKLGNEKEAKLVRYKYNAKDKNFEEVGRYDIK